MNIISIGFRDANEDFWRLSGVLNTYAKSHDHAPFIVVTEDTIKAYKDLEELINQQYAEDTMIIRAWPGQWRTDYFVFTFNDLVSRVKSKGLEV